MTFSKSKFISPPIVIIFFICTEKFCEQNDDVVNTNNVNEDDVSALRERATLVRVANAQNNLV